MAMLEREMRHLAKQAGGAHKTVSDRMAQAKRFCEHLLEQNVQIRYVKHLKARHIEDYVRHRLAQGIDKRTRAKRNVDDTRGAATGRTRKAGRWRPDQQPGGGDRRRIAQRYAPCDHR